MADPRIKQLKIKTGVCKRFTKEKFYYEKEEVTEKERYDKKKADGADDSTLNKQMEVINESKAMILDTRGKLKKARDDLSNVLDAEADLKETTEYKDAQAVLEAANKAIEEDADKA